LINFGRSLLAEELQPPSNGAKLKYLTEVTTSVKRVLGQPPRIYTLNYDLCLEHALTYCDMPYTTGFRDGRWDHTVFNEHDKIAIVKLHGSFGWVRHPQTMLLFDKEAAIQRDDIDFVGDSIDDELIFAIDHKLQGRQPFLWMVNDFAEK